MNIPSESVPHDLGERNRIISDALQRSVSRMRDSLRVDNIAHIGDVSMGRKFGDLSLHEMAYLHQHPEHELNALVWVDCHGRPDPSDQTNRLACVSKSRFQCSAYFAPMTACDDCRNAAIKHDQLQNARTYWESICPENYRDTDKKHPEFPAGIFATLSDYKGAESLFLYGPSGSAKTRCAMLLMKRCLLANLHVGCLWPEELKHAAHSYNDRLKLLKSYARYDLLLLDDALLTGAQDEKMASFLVDLVDLLMRSKHRFIITSQIGGDDYTAQAQKSDKTTKVDMDRIDALLRRIRQSCRVVPFITATPAADSGDIAF